MLFEGLAEFVGEANLTRWIIPVVMPRITPTTRNTITVLNWRSIQNPSNPGSTISREMVVTREVHSAATTSGGRSFGESFTD